MMMAMIFLQIPIPAGCQNIVSGSESWFLIMAAQRNSIWEKCRTPIFSGQRVYIGGRRGACCGTIDVNHRPVGNPKRKV
jgi:hypothetical protein